MQYKIAKYKPESTIRHQGWTVGGLETNLPRSRVDYLFLFICFYSAILHERGCLHSIEKTLKLSRKLQKYFGLFVSIYAWDVENSVFLPIFSQEFYITRCLEGITVFNMKKISSPRVTWIPLWSAVLYSSAEWLVTNQLKLNPLLIIFWPVVIV